MITLEICAQSFEAAIHAYEGGAHRIELCIDLPTGGLTPSVYLIKKVKKEIDIPVFVLIRSRPGNFIYNEVEVFEMCEDIKKSIDAGADGIVCGALRADHTIDEHALNLFKHSMDVNIPFTFHRAIEQVSNIYKSIDLLVDYEVNRILTGGSKGNAYTSKEELKSINQYINNRVILLAGSGINSKNVNEIVQTADLKEVHASAKFGKKAMPANDPSDSNPKEVMAIIHKLQML